MSNWQMFIDSDSYANNSLCVRITLKLHIREYISLKSILYSCVYVPYVRKVMYYCILDIPGSSCYTQRCEAQQHSTRWQYDRQSIRFWHIQGQSGNGYTFMNQTSRHSWVSTQSLHWNIIISYNIENIKQMSQLLQFTVKQETIQ